MPRQRSHRHLREFKHIAEGGSPRLAAEILLISTCAPVYITGSRWKFLTAASLQSGLVYGFVRLIWRRNRS